MRIGQGFDAHRFAPGSALMLGGIRVPYDQGLAAHSDGDVVLHALCDALLGAAALGDIGKHFPDTSDEWRDADSRVLLRHVVERVRAEGFQISNVDVTVIAEKPKLSTFMPAMCECIAADLQIPAGRVSLKATTTEKMGFTGRGEGVAATAVALLEE
jgi:2-C-methyl-D-erythritol 2,4-cyclodiphosphate synthase